MKTPMKLEGWKARVVLIAAIVILVNLALTIPLAIVLGMMH